MVLAALVVPLYSLPAPLAVLFAFGLFLGVLLALPRPQRVGWLGFGVSTILIGALLYSLALPGANPFALGPLQLGLDGTRLGARDMSRALGVFSVAALASRWIAARELLPLIARRPYPFYVAASLVRLVPTVRDDFERIGLSLAARGHEPRRRWFRAASFVPLLVPLFVSTMRRAREQAVVVELSGLAPRRRRT